MNNRKVTDFIHKNNQLTLLCPQSLRTEYKIQEINPETFKKKLKLFQDFIQLNELSEETFTMLQLKLMPRLKSQSNAIELLHSEGKLKHLKQEDVEVFNNYFDVQHILTEFPEYILLSSAFAGYVTFLGMTKKNSTNKWTRDKLDTLVNPEFKPLLIWKRFHWIFLIFIQGLIICLLRFEKAIKFSQLNQIKIELRTASNLMIGAGAAMELAGSYSKKEYQAQIFPTMKPPNLNLEGFSGLMSWDHAYLVRLWKQNTKNFHNLPPSLQVQYEKFLLAYKSMASSHRHICSKFGGSQVGGSVKHPTDNALLALEKICLARWQTINPSHKSVNESMDMSNDPCELIQTGFKNHIQLLFNAFNLEL